MIEKNFHKSNLNNLDILLQGYSYLQSNCWYANFYHCGMIKAVLPHNLQIIAISCWFVFEISLFCHLKYCFSASGHLSCNYEFTWYFRCSIVFSLFPNKPSYSLRSCSLDSVWPYSSEASMVWEPWTYQMFKLNLQFKLNLEKSKRSNCQHPLDHRNSKSSKKICFYFIDYAKAFDSVDHNKLENS